MNYTCNIFVEKTQILVEKKENKCWLWHAINHEIGEILAFVLGTRQDEVFLQLKKLLEPFKIKKFYTDDLKTYSLDYSLPSMSSE
jgi:insertion element IS1 protein InsB